MKQLFCLFIMILFQSILQLSAQSQNGVASFSEDEKAAVQKLVESTYCEVLCKGNEDLGLLDRGCHPSFHMYVYYDDELTVRTLETWKERIAASFAGLIKAGRKVDYSWTFREIEVSGQTAMAILDVYAGDKLKYTDFLSLYKIEEEWKMMSKLFSYY